ncbi:DUF429 domain-containing protein [Elongatibacter sediminis]|uniref:DUF429 domain-containing protein n=1 Tax=Elongatibacter sediminis TaxID=3119006 RepID=A0AAW9RJZ5_9GAMM
MKHSPPQGPIQVAGVDGCRGGWLFFILKERKNFEVGIEISVENLFQRLNCAELALIDMPIGLPTPDCPIRACDTEARRTLGTRRSSVFPVPARSALSASSYAEACEENLRVLERSMSRQSWAIAPKIRELDDYLRQCAPDGRIREMHPEVAFWALNFEQPLRETKKSRAGERERLAILRHHYPAAQECFEACCRAYPRAQVARDDILDAIAGAVSARFAPHLATLPATPPADDAGLPQEIVYPVVPRASMNDPGPLPGDFQAEAAELVGRIVFAWSRFERNLGLTLQYAQGEPDEDTFKNGGFKGSVGEQLKALGRMVRENLANEPEGIGAFEVWLKHASNVRMKRNAIVHGRWTLLSGQRLMQLESTELPGVDASGKTRFSLAKLENELRDIESMDQDLYQLRVRWLSLQAPRVPARGGTS